MIAYLSTAPLPLPWETAPATEPLGAELGTLTPSFERGDLFLKNADGDAFRLSWTGTEEGEARTRALPIGDYTLQTYRIVREQDDELWHISATRPKIQEIEVLAGKNTIVEVEDEIRMSSKLGHGRAQMGIEGESHSGLSIYRDGKRIPIGYRILDDEGTQLASGSMRYG